MLFVYLSYYYTHIYRYIYEMSTPHKHTKSTPFECNLATRGEFRVRGFNLRLFFN